MVEFRPITEENFPAIVNMKRPDGERFVASNEHSLAQAWLYRDAGDVFPFAIYADGQPVGFMMLDEDAEERVLMLWRIMFPEEHANKGYGTQAIQKVIDLARDSRKYDKMVIDYVPGNGRAAHLYEKLGFRPTGGDQPWRDRHGVEILRVGGDAFYEPLAKHRGKTEGPRTGRHAHHQ